MRLLKRITLWQLLGKSPMGEHQSPAIPSLHHCLQEGRGFYILSCSLNFLFTFPFLPKPPWLELTAVLFPAFGMAFTSWKGGDLPDSVCTSALTIRWPQETGTERLTCSPRLAQALATNMRQMIYLISFKVLLHEWEVWLDQANFMTWRNLSCQKCVIKWKVFPSVIFSLFQGHNLCYFYILGLACCKYTPKQSFPAEEKTSLCIITKKKFNRVSNEIKLIMYT